MRSASLGFTQPLTYRPAKLRNFAFLFSLLLFGISSSCSKPNSMPRNETQTDELLPPQSGDRSFWMLWAMEEQPLIKSDDFTFVAHAMTIKNYETSLIFSLSGVSVNGLTIEDFVFQLIDDQKRAAPAVASNIVLIIEDVHFGVVTFGQRPAGSSELFLKMFYGADGENVSQTKLATFSEPYEPTNVWGSRQYQIGANSEFDQGNLRISFAGWHNPRAPNGADTPQPPEGIVVEEQATLQVIDQSTSRPFSVVFIFLSNGEIRGSIVE